MRKLENSELFEISGGWKWIVDIYGYVNEFGTLLKKQ